MSGSDETSSKKRPGGIPVDHPSVGKDVREPVTGPSWPPAKDHGGGRMITRWHELVWGIALAVWIIYSRFWFICPNFKDPDAAKMAFGVAQRLGGISFSDGIFYQIEKTFGSYLIYEFLARVFQIDIASLGHFMAVTNAAFMVGILLLSYHLGVMIWGYRVGLVSVTVLALSPMMWITGEYPTSLVPALFFFMLAIWAMVWSYRVRGGRYWLIASGLLFAWAIIVRMDMALGLLAPVCYAFFVDRRGLRRTLILYAIIAIALIAAWLPTGIPLPEILKVGPHHPDYPKSLSLNWWGMGPFLFVFAFAGFVYRFVTDRKPLPFIFFWIVGFNSFYTGHLYSPHFFISYFPVVSWLAAFSIIALYGWLVRLVHYNRPMRVLIMLLFALGALSMLTVSTIREGDGKTRLAWGETISYARDHGLHPTGSVWFFMQEFRRGDSLQFSFAENGARRTVEELLNPESDIYYSDGSPIYIGNVSQDYINYFLLANGWTYEGKRGPFLNFKYVFQPPKMPPGVEISWDAPPPLIMQTVKIEDAPIPELAFLTNPTHASVLIGSDAMPCFISQEGSVGAPIFTAIGGWHVGHSFDGLDLIVPGPTSSQSDGTIDCERELVRFFHLDPLPRYHIEIIPTDETDESFGGTVTSHDGRIVDHETGPYIENISEIAWTAESPALRPHRWLALAINRGGFLPEYEISVNGEFIENPQWLRKNINGYATSRWDILLIPPEYIDSSQIEFKLESVTRGSIYDIYFVQRTYPDCQFINETAIPLDLEFKDITCIQ